MEKGSQVVYVGNLSENLKKYLESIGAPVPVKDVTKEIVDDVIIMRPECPYQIGLKFKKYPSTLTFNSADWQEVEQLSTLTVDTLLQANSIPIEYQPN